MFDLSITLSFIALATGFAWAACWAVGLWYGSRPDRVATMVPLVLSCCLLGAAGIFWANSEGALLGKLNLMAAITAVASALGVQVSPTTRQRLLGAGCLWLLAAVIGNFLLVTSYSSNAFAPGVAATKVRVDDAVLVTDQGRIFGVFRFAAEHYVDNAMELFGDKLVLVAPADMSSNCHGFVFADGQYAVPDTAVAALLDDNGYAAVQSPSLDDVVVYRDDAGKILHSGLVHRVDEDGQVWIESKWGPGGRYLHRPEDQCYSRLFTYYHSRRLEHGAQIVQLTAGKDSRVARSDTTPARRARG